jgi:glucose-1-phosphate cytidylyltransferase
MKYYAHYGHREFILCLGHGGDAIREYFRVSPDGEEWQVTLADPGVHSSIGERLSMVKRHVEGDEVFLANYADGLTDLHLPSLIDALAGSGKVGALLCTKPSLSYHFVRTNGDGTVVELREPGDVELRINGGYFVFRTDIFDYIRAGEDLVGAPFHRLTNAGQLLGYRYDGFWKNMDTFKDKQVLDDLAASGAAPWEVWRRAAGPGSG